MLIFTRWTTPQSSIWELIGELNYMAQLIIETKNNKSEYFRRLRIYFFFPINITMRPVLNFVVSINRPVWTELRGFFSLSFYNIQHCNEHLLKIDRKLAVNTNRLSCCLIRFSSSGNPPKKNYFLVQLGPSLKKRTHLEN